MSWAPELTQIWLPWFVSVAVSGDKECLLYLELLPTGKNPFEAYGDEAFRRRYRLRKETVLAVAGMMPDMMPDPRGPFVPALLQLCSFLLWAANGCFFRMVADVVGVHRAHMSRVVQRISRALVALAPRVIRGIPRGGAAHATRQAFWDLAGNYYSFTLMCGRISQYS